MVQITARHMVGGTQHEHIASVQWLDPNTRETGVSSRETMIDFIEKKSGKAVVHNGGRTVDVGVVHANPPYLRTHADGQWTDNLLALPIF